MRRRVFCRAVVAVWRPGVWYQGASPGVLQLKWPLLLLWMWWWQCPMEGLADGGWVDESNIREPWPVAGDPPKSTSGVYACMDYYTFGAGWYYACQTLGGGHELSWVSVVVVVLRRDSRGLHVNMKGAIWHLSLVLKWNVYIYIYIYIYIHGYA